MYHELFWLRHAGRGFWFFCYNWRFHYSFVFHRHTIHDGMAGHPVCNHSQKQAGKHKCCSEDGSGARHQIRLRPSGQKLVTAAAAKPAVRYIGCYKRETSFGEDRKYAGSTTGAYLGLARAHAVASGKRFVAVARLGGDGHAFAFNAPVRDPEASGGGCDRACLDDKDYACGCSDTACTETPDAGEDNVRRWAVYEILADGATGTTRSSGRGAGRKAAGGK